MDIKSNWVRMGGGAGIAFIILFVICIIVQGTPPDFDASGDETAAWFRDNRDKWLIADYLIAVGFLFFFLPFLSVLRSLFARAEGDPPMLSRTFYAAGLIVLLIGAVGSVFADTLAFQAAKDADDSIVKTLTYLYAFTFYSSFAIAEGAFLVFGSLLILQTGVLWRWLGAGAIVGILMVVAGLSTLSTDPDSALYVLWYVVSAIGGLWILLVSVGLIMRGEALAVAQPSASPA